MKEQADGYFIRGKKSIRKWNGIWREKDNTPNKQITTNTKTQKPQDVLLISKVKILHLLLMAAGFIIKGFADSLHFDVNTWK